MTADDLECLFRSFDDPQVIACDFVPTETAQDSSQEFAGEVSALGAVSSGDLPVAGNDAITPVFSVPDFESESEESDDHPDIFALRVPDAGATSVVESEADLQPEITSKTRARQHAISFLRDFDDVSPDNIEYITDIILSRKWSSVQRKVRELLAGQYSVPAVHLIFEISEAWRQCDWLDQHVNEFYLYRPATLTWREAANLVDFFGSDADLGDIMDFVDVEHHAWRARPHLRRLYPMYKNYLIQDVLRR